MGHLLDYFRPIEIIFDLIMFVDIVLNFFTGYMRNILIMDVKKVWLNYIFGRFGIEFLAVVPGLVTGEMIYQIYMLKILRFL
jgi:hypothetical protein